VAMTADRLRLRPETEAFAQAMERKLVLNDHKGGRENWRQDGPRALLDRVREEVDEVDQALAWLESVERALVLAPYSERDALRAMRDSARESVLHEAADVANMAMMVADSAEALAVEGD
jgi:NTP pyrophosphatase (non-canonical NTP hydrolase)